MFGFVVEVSLRGDQSAGNDIINAQIPSNLSPERRRNKSNGRRAEKHAWEFNKLFKSHILLWELTIEWYWFKHGVGS